MPLTPEQIEILAKVRSAGGSVREAAKAAGVAPSTAAKRFPDPIKERTIKEDGDNTTVEYLSPRQIKTLEDALSFAQVDTTIFYVEKWECTSWEVITKNAAKQAERHHLWRVRLFLKRIVPKIFIGARKLLCERLAVPRLDFKPPAARPLYGRPVLCLFDLFDMHWGKLSWDKEVGQNYDVKITETIFKNAVDDLLGLVGGFDIEEFLIPIGNDFLHIDNLRNETTSGTMVDTDGRFPKIYASAKLAVIQMIEYLICFAPVRIIFVPGNHDRLCSYFLCDAISERFHNIKIVQVDAEPTTRKYHRYGCNLLGFIHGDKVPGDGVKLLPTIMAAEQREIWSQITNPEWHLGHKHTQRKFSTRDMDTMNGTVVRWLSSLSATDFWHYENLFIGNKRAAEVYIYDKERGYVGHFNSIARTD